MNEENWECDVRIGTCHSAASAVVAAAIGIVSAAPAVVAGIAASAAKKHDENQDNPKTIVAVHEFFTSH